MAQPKPDKQILIIGAGIAGTIAARALSRYRPHVVDSRKDISIHDAVMHLRDPGVAKYLGVPVREVAVRKEIFCGERLHSTPSVRFNNLYSLKLYGALGRRSLNDLGEVKRWVIEGDLPQPENCHLGTKVDNIVPSGADGTKMCVSMIELGNGRRYIQDFDWIISTAAMPVNFRMTDISVPGGTFGFSKVHTCRIDLQCPSSVHQVIYFPDPKDGDVYRASIDGRWLSIESNAPVCDMDKSLALRAFGIMPDFYDAAFRGSTEDHKAIDFGKIKPMPETARRANILRLTQDARLLSFGRHAIWKPIRADHLSDDIEKIRRLIESTDALRRYEQQHYQGEGEHIHPSMGDSSSETYG